MIRLLRRLFPRRDRYTQAVDRYAKAGKGERRDALKTLKRVATEELRRAVG